jgi:hypothetical protein
MNDPESSRFARQMKEIIHNRQRLAPEALQPYQGQCVAWAPDGHSIVAHADDFETLDKRVREAGFDPSRCVYDRLDDEPAI